MLTHSLVSPSLVPLSTPTILSPPPNSSPSTFVSFKQTWTLRVRENMILVFLRLALFDQHDDLQVPSFSVHMMHLLFLKADSQGPSLSTGSVCSESGLEDTVVREALVSFCLLWLSFMGTPFRSPSYFWAIGSLRGPCGQRWRRGSMPEA